jgi:hypothetical protein
MKIFITLVLPLLLLGSAVAFANTGTKMTSHGRFTRSMLKHSVATVQIRPAR